MLPEPFGRICHWGPLTAIGKVNEFSKIIIYCNIKFLELVELIFILSIRVVIKY